MAKLICNRNVYDSQVHSVFFCSIVHCVLHMLPKKSNKSYVPKKKTVRFRREEVHGGKKKFY